MTNDADHLHDRLRAAREYLGISQHDLAEHLGLSRSAITKIELGQRKVTAQELSELAKALRRPVAHFLAEEDPADSSSETARALFRAAEQLTEDDQRQVLQFVEFLRSAGQPPRPDEGHS